MANTTEHAIHAPKVTVALKTYDNRSRREACFLHPDHCVVDFALTSRPRPTRGTYEARWNPSRYEPIGDVMVLAPGMALKTSIAAGLQRAVTCYFHPDVFAVDWDQLDDEALIETLNLQNADVKRGLRRIFQEATHPTLASAIVIEAATTLLAVDVARHLAKRKTAPRKQGGLSHARMRSIEERLQADGPLPTLAELAAHCGLSTRHLARAFREETGRAIGEYVRAAGLERACTLLRTTDLNIRAIGESVGFSNATSFSYAFRNATGLRPSDIRNGMRRPPSPGRVAARG